ncbi:MAG: threonine ammonia-lyase, biosynthetic [Gammaproteobacteria bacterium]|nr:threonine ammonia-lyase, biosynthetic [Gammaproteobacteria bacterium]
MRAFREKGRVLVNDYVRLIGEAQVYDVARETPLEEAPNLGWRLHNQVLLKREDLQPVFSFKLRGAYNKLVSLTPTERAAGVVAASAGNHAQGVALSARTLGIQATIVMPTTTPEIKVRAVQSYGAEVVLHGDNYDAAYAQAKRLRESRGATFVHPYDDPLVIAGQGTIAAEILRQRREPIDAIFVPVGGGGLISGIAVYMKALSPGTRVIGVESDDADALYQSLAVKERVLLNQVGIFVDGTAVRQVGAETFRLAQRYVDEVVRVSVDEVCAAIKDVFEETRSIMEPAGALATAGLKAWVETNEVKDKTLVSICSGANMNFDRLRHVAERASIGEHSEAILAVTIPETPGSFLSFCKAIGQHNITEFNYRYADESAAHVFVGVRVGGGGEDAAELVTRLGRSGYQVLDLSTDEMAKLHVRYMVGGRAGVTDERLCRVEFPERPGALAGFLGQIGQRWNISLFHYRNHGAAYGRVLLGLQVPPGEWNDFSALLDGLGYPYSDESENPAYQLFLR